jgi:hypothetical protein
MLVARFKVLLDANVLYPFTLRDTLLRAASEAPRSRRVSLPGLPGRDDCARERCTVLGTLWMPQVAFEVETLVVADLFAWSHRSIASVTAPLRVFRKRVRTRSSDLSVSTGGSPPPWPRISY